MQTFSVFSGRACAWTARPSTPASLAARAAYSESRFVSLAGTKLTGSLRIPTKYSGGKEYQEKIWDHASGCLLIHESGGICTDMNGKKLDFGVGRTLKSNEGIVAAGKEIHPKAIEAVNQAIST